jgi:type II secretory pathway pseudopilin PulG
MRLLRHAKTRHSRPRTRPDIGDTLVEVVLAVVIIGLTVTALLSALANAGHAGNVQRSLVEMDATMRNYAEATKSAVQSCTAGGSYSVSFMPPADYSVSAAPASTICPSVANPAVLDLTVQGPLGVHETMQIIVRTP